MFPETFVELVNAVESQKKGDYQLLGCCGQDRLFWYLQRILMDLHDSYHRRAFFKNVRAPHDQRMMSSHLQTHQKNWKKPLYNRHVPMQWILKLMVIPGNLRAGTPDDTR